MKRRIVLMLVVLLSLVCTGVFAEGQKETGAAQSAGGAPTQKYVIKFAHVSPANRATAMGVERFKQLVEERSNGRVEVQVYGNAQLGGDAEAIQGLQLGTIQMTGAGGSTYSRLYKGFLVFDLPFLFPTREDAFRVFDSETGKKILAGLESKGIKGLSYWESGYRVMTNNVRPITRPADLKGIKMRTLQNPIYLAFYRAWGANPTPMPIGEVYTALQTGTVDGQGTVIQVDLGSHYYEVQKYLSVTNHVYGPWIVSMSLSYWKSLPPDLQSIVQKAADEAGAYERALDAKQDLAALDQLRTLGVKVNTLTPEATKEFQQLAKPVWNQFADQIGQDLIDEVVRAQSAQ